MKHLQNFFMEEFRELYRCEKRWLIILPEVARNMPPPAVERAVVQHLERTAARVIYLEELFRLMADAGNRDWRTIKPFLKEADDVLAAVALSSTAVRQRVLNRKPLQSRRNRAPAGVSTAFPSQN